MNIKLVISPDKCVPSMSFFDTVIKILGNIIFITSTDPQHLSSLFDLGQGLPDAATNYTEQKIQGGGQ